MSCSSRTLEVYEANLYRFQRATGLPTLEAILPLAIQRYLAGLQGRLKPISLHQHYRCLRAFLGWCIEAPDSFRPTLCVA